MVCPVALEVVLQKFVKTPRLASELLETGDKIIVEAAPKDTLWGAGVGLRDWAIHTPAKWTGSNVLGWALMEVQDIIRTLPAWRTGPNDDQLAVQGSEEARTRITPHLLRLLSRR